MCMCVRECVRACVRVITHKQRSLWMMQKWYKKDLFRHICRWSPASTKGAAPARPFALSFTFYVFGCRVKQALRSETIEHVEHLRLFGGLCFRKQVKKEKVLITGSKKIVWRLLIIKRLLTWIGIEKSVSRWVAHSNYSFSFSLWYISTGWMHSFNSVNSDP